MVLTYGRWSCARVGMSIVRSVLSILLLRSVPGRLPGGLETLDVSRNAVRKLGGSVYRVPMRLDVSDNQLSALPPPASGKTAAAAGATIRGIDAARNRIERLPAAGLRNLRCLTALGLADNRLDEVSPELGQLRYLRRLDVSRNRLRALPGELCRLDRSLEELRVAGNRLARLPADFGRFRRLAVLDASDNELSELPADLGAVASLRAVDLSGNRVVDVGAIVGLARCEELDLAANRITRLPDELHLLGSLVSLDVSRNRLTCLPDGLGLVPTLKHLRAAGNQIAELPATIGVCQLLATLVLSDNRLESLPPDLGRLRTVETFLVDGNRLTELPRTADRMSALQRLDVGRNQLTRLAAVPPAVTSLCVSANPLRTAADDPRGSLLVRLGDPELARRLVHLSLARLGLDEFPPAVTSLRMLTSLDLSHNRVARLPRRENLARLVNVRRLDLAANSRLRSLDGVRVLEQLERLDASGNALERFSDDLTTLRCLQHLDLTDNRIASLPDNFGQLRFGSFFIPCVTRRECHLCRVAGNTSGGSTLGPGGPKFYRPPTLAVLLTHCGRLILRKKIS